LINVKIFNLAIAQKHFYFSGFIGKPACLHAFLRFSPPCRKYGRLAEDFVALQRKFAVLHKFSPPFRVSGRLAGFLAVLQVGKPPCSEVTRLSGLFSVFLVNSLTHPLPPLYM